MTTANTSSKARTVKGEKFEHWWWPGLARDRRQGRVLWIIQAGTGHPRRTDR
ncbi:MAG TPA: hypothetical protein VJT49_19505 [Amycolatopsis sp.]|nr:hypothetical protein [Amycolatopsis sp.]